MGVFEDVVMQARTAPGPLGLQRERRQEPRLPERRTSRTGLSANLWELELLPAFALNRLAGDIGGLSRYSLEPNVFFDPTVVQAAWPRLTGLLAPKGCWMACLWETIGDTRRLRLFMPVRLSASGLPRKTVLEVLSNEFMPVGAPLIDRETAEEACEMLLILLPGPELGTPHVMDFTHLRADGPVFAALRKAATSLGLPQRSNRAHDRAALLARDEPGDDPVRDFIGAKGDRELSRQLRRLEESGPVTFHCATVEEDVLDSFEAFVGLELAGWKGRRATAIYNHKKIAAFSREIAARLSVEGACEIFEMRHRGRVVASLILFGRGRRFVTWKMAFDESLAKASPGMQLMAHATRHLLARGDFVEADSLAVADHFMMNRIWPDRIPIADLTIALTPAATPEMLAAVAAKERLDRWKTRAKRVLERLHLR